MEVKLCRECHTKAREVDLGPREVDRPAHGVNEWSREVIYVPNAS